MLLLVAFGIAVISLLPYLAPIILGYLGIPSAVLLFIKTGKKKICALIIGLSIGIILNHGIADRLWQPSWHGQDIQVSGWIEDIPRDYIDRTSFMMRVDGAYLHNLESQIIPVKHIKLSWRQAQYNVKPGEYYQFKVRLKQPRGSNNPGLFNYQIWAISSGLDATGYVKSLVKRHRDLDEVNVDTLRYHMLNIIDTIISKYRLKQGPILKALLLGDKNDINQDTWHLLRATGVVHIVVISGLHIGLIALFGFLFGSLIGRGVQFIAPSVTASQVAAIFAIIASIFYASLAGFSLPTQRAVIMIVALLLAQILRINISLFSRISLGLLGIFLIQPLAIFQASFWLSFGAVIILLAYFSGSKPTSYLAALIKSQWALFLGFSILLIIFFGEFSILAPIANLLILWIISLLVIPILLILSFSILLGYPLPSLLYAADWIVDHVFLLLHSLYLPEALVQVYAPIGIVALAGASVIILLLPFASWWRYAALVGILPLFFYTGNTDKPPLQMRLFDVGQGLSLIVETPNHSLVYDVGKKFSDRFDYGRHVIGAFLRKKGIQEVDMLVLSHNDNDHVGGAMGFMQMVHPKQIISGQKMDNIPTKLCKSDTSWIWDNIHFQFIYGGHITKNDNDASCVLSIRSAEHSILLTGDITRKVEKLLIAQDIKHHEVLLVPHHGSRSSSSQGFIDKIAPKIALISSGWLNRYHHPHPIIVERYEQANAEIFNTAEYGSIRFTFTQEGYTIEHSKNLYRPWWLK